MQNYASIIAQELNIRPQQTEAVIRLLDKDAQYQLFLRATLGDVTYDATFLFAADG